jgi:hypothetical protein
MEAQYKAMTSNLVATIHCGCGQLRACVERYVCGCELDHGTWEPCEVHRTRSFEEWMTEDANA